MKSCFKNRRIFVYCLFSFLLSACSTTIRKAVTRTATQPYSTDLNLSFEWTNDSLAGHFYEKSAMLVPVQINGFDTKLFMQFDLGSPSTILYGKTLQTLMRQYPQNKVRIKQVKKKQRAENIVLNFDKTSVSLVNKIPIMPQMGDDTLSNIPIIIGTLGYDFIKGKIVTIDYPNKKMLLSEQIPMLKPEELEEIEASTRYFPVIITMNIGNKKKKVMFDTGSSLFSLITSNKKFKQIEPNQNSNIDSLCCIKAWGKDYSFFEKKLKQPIIVGRDTLFNQKIMTTEREKWKADLGFNLIGIYGITGNALFWNDLIILDTKNNHFWTKKGQ